VVSTENERGARRAQKKDENDRKLCGLRKKKGGKSHAVKKTTIFSQIGVEPVGGLREKKCDGRANQNKSGACPIVMGRKLKTGAGGPIPFARRGKPPSKGETAGLHFRGHTLMLGDPCSATGEGRTLTDEKGKSWGWGTSKHAGR